MTIGELVKELENLGDNTPVLVNTPESGYMNIETTVFELYKIDGVECLCLIVNLQPIKNGKAS